MTRKADLIITIFFLLYYTYYTSLGFVFGGMSRENYYPYLVLTAIGLLLIVASLLFKTIPIFSGTRITGIILIIALLYFDIKGSFIFKTKWDVIKTTLTYFPVIVFLIFLVLSLIRIFDNK
jgi:hypothetical protein